MDFDNRLFSRGQIKIINELTISDNKVSIYYAKLSGKLLQKNMVSVLTDKLFKTKHEEDKYKLNQVLARLGRRESIIVVRDSLKKMNTEDRLWQKQMFFYIRQKPLIDLLFDDLFSDERVTAYFEKWMESPLEKLCAFDALNILTRVVKDFPVKEKSSYSSDDLKTARKWAKTHKNSYVINDE
jgi:hypothetical protein